MNCTLKIKERVPIVVPPFMKEKGGEKIYRYLFICAKDIKGLNLMKSVTQDWVGAGWEE